ncbi:MAG: preprotein translocase subunit SecE [Candidatus Pacebacteria bacterium]|nr:preprotein translocase subunit SecE [Candidatus Paceibacterota bacterium]
MKAIQFLKETKIELRHVVWPTRRRALTYALIIIVFSLALGYMLSGFDVLFRELLKTVVVR